MIHGIVSILIVVAVFILYTEFQKWKIKKKLRHFESPKQYPIIGVAARFLGKPNDEIIETILNAFDEVKSSPVQAWFGPILAIGISEPRDIQIVLNSEHCLNKPYFYDNLHCKTSIIATKREVWRPNRRALNPSFNVAMIQSYVPLLNEKSRILLQKMDAHVGKPGNLYQTIFICMMDMVTKTTMGSECNLQETDRGESLYKIAKKIMNNIQYRLTRYWLRWDATYALTQVYRDEQISLAVGNRLFDEMYEKKREQLQMMRANGIDYLEEVKDKNATNFLERCMLLERDGYFNHENVLDQMRVIVLAGIDTSSITVFSTLLMLAINQKHQDLVVEELRSIFETADCEIGQSHLTGMNYLERVIKESLRLIPPVPFIARKTSSDIELAKGVIPKNTMVIVNIMQLHRNPNIYENVLEFDPDRWLPENIAKRPAFSYIPFSAGSRNCIGMRYAMISAKITLAYLLRRYKFSTHLRFDEIRLNTHLVTEVVNENPLHIEKRNL